MLGPADDGTGALPAPGSLQPCKCGRISPFQAQLAGRAQGAQTTLDDVDRAFVAVIVAQDVGHPRRLNVGPILERVARLATNVTASPTLCSYCSSGLRASSSTLGHKYATTTSRSYISKSTA
jgi:hypothetical protein